jgi:hypothetical protein
MLQSFELCVVTVLCCVQVLADGSLALMHGCVWSLAPLVLLLLDKRWFWRRVL